MTEENKQETYAKLLDSVKDVEKENEILHGKLLVQTKQLNTQHEMIERLEKMQSRILEDIELSPSTYRNQTTRTLAFDAFQQSTVSANWEGLADHPVITNIYKSIKDRRNEQEERIEEVLQRFEDRPTKAEFLDELEKSWQIKEIKDNIRSISQDLEGYSLTQRTDRIHANKQDHRIWDKMADMQISIGALDFILGNTTERMESAFIYLMGVWARSGQPSIEEGLRIILMKSKEEREKDEKVQDTLPESQE